MHFANVLGLSRPFSSTARDTGSSSILGPTVATPGRITSTGSRSQSSMTDTQRGSRHDRFNEDSNDAKSYDRHVDAIRPSTGITSEGDAVREKYGGLINSVLSQVPQSGKLTIFGSSGWCITYPPQDAGLGQNQDRRKQVTRIVIGPPTAIRCNGCGATTRYKYARRPASKKPKWSSYTYNPGCELTKEERTNPDHGLERWQYTNCHGSMYDAADIHRQTEFVKAGNGRAQLEHAKAQDNWVLGNHIQALEMDEDEGLVRLCREQEWLDNEERTTTG